MVRRSLVVLAALIALALVANAAATDLGRYWVSRTIQSSLSLPQRPSVSLGGFPLLPKLLAGRLPSFSVHIPSLAEGKVSLSSVNLVLSSVRFSRAKFLTGHLGRLSAGRAEGTATISAPAMAAALTEPGRRVRIQIDRGRILLSEGVIDRPTRSRT